MAAGPGIRPRAPGSPCRAGRSARNYPHLVAAALGHRPGRRHLLRGHHRPHPARPAERRAAADRSARRLGAPTPGHHHHRRQRRRLRAAADGREPAAAGASLPVLGPPCVRCWTRRPATRRSTGSVPRCGRSARRCARGRRRHECVRRLPDAAAAAGQAGRRRCRTTTPTWAATSPTGWRRDRRRGRRHRLRAGPAGRGQPRPPRLVGGAVDRRRRLPAGPWRPAPLHPNAAGMRAVADLVVEAVRPGR